MRIAHFQLFALLCFILLITSCKTKQSISSYSDNPDGRYDSEFPDKSVSDNLNDISRTIKKIDCLAFYMTYTFPPDNNLRKSALTEENIKSNAINNEITNEAVAGTATVIYYNGRILGLLTCAHVLDFADTLYNWYDEGQKRLHSISVKVRQQNYVTGLPEGGDIDIIAMDKKNDIALLRKRLEPHDERPQVFNYKVGNTKELEWGTFVYIMGYPLGNLMVTRAIVSNPEKAKNGFFLTDALFNRGISGSPVFALRDGVPNFEWIGMAKSSSADNFIYLKPDEDLVKVINTKESYGGEHFVDQKLEINYGVTFSVTIEAISKFLKKNKEQIKKAGIDIEELFP